MAGDNYESDDDSDYDPKDDDVDTDDDDFGVDVDPNEVAELVQKSRLSSEEIRKLYDGIRNTAYETHFGGNEGNFKDFLDTIDINEATRAANRIEGDAYRSKRTDKRVIKLLQQSFDDFMKALYEACDRKSHKSVRPGPRIVSESSQLHRFKNDLINKLQKKLADAELELVGLKRGGGVIEEIDSDCSDSVNYLDFINVNSKKALETYPVAPMKLSNDRL